MTRRGGHAFNVLYYIIFPFRLDFPNRSFHVTDCTSENTFHRGISIVIINRGTEQRGCEYAILYNAPSVGRLYDVAVHAEYQRGEKIESFHLTFVDGN